MAVPYLEGADRKAGAVVVDIGGYIADFDQLVAKTLVPGSVLEPTPDNFAMAKANAIAGMGLPDKIELHNMAIGDGLRQ